MISGRCSNVKRDPPPHTVPYSEYNFPNWKDRMKDNFQQHESGFGFSNFRQNHRLPTTANSNQIFGRNSQTMPDNIEGLIEVERSETRLFTSRYGDYQLYEECATGNDNNQAYDDVINRTITTNPLMRLFFSKTNIDHVLRLICKLIREICHGYKITPEAQNKNELLTIFRSMYLQVPTDPYNNLEEGLVKLNRAVIDWAVPRMVVNIQSYLGYIRDASTRRMTIDRPANVSIAGTKTNIMTPVC